MSVKRFILGLFVCCSLVPLLAQAHEEQKFDEPSMPTTREFMNKMKERFSGATLTLGYRRLILENPTFYKYREDGFLTPGNALQFGFRGTAYPIQWDLNVYLGVFGVDKKLPLYDSKGSKEDHKVTAYGASTYLSVLPFFDMGGISEFIRPYLGVGYGVNALSVADKTQANSSEEEGLGSVAGRLVFYEPMWKVGTHISLGFINLYGEYRQAMRHRSPYMHSEWVVGFSFLH